MHSTYHSLGAYKTADLLGLGGGDTFTITSYTGHCHWRPLPKTC